MEIKNEKGTKNSMANHLSRLEGPKNEVHINDKFPNEHLSAISNSNLVP